MKRSTYHQIVGALICSGNENLADTIIAAAIKPGSKAMMDAIRIGKLTKRLNEFKKSRQKATTPKSRNNWQTKILNLQKRIAHLKSLR